MAITYVLLRERVDELGKDLVGDDGLGQFIRVVGEAAKSESGRLLNRWDVIQKQRSQKSHNACRKMKNQFQFHDGAI